MSYDQSVPSSDLEFAVQLSRRLRDDGHNTSRLDPRPRYVRFDARRFLPGGVELGQRKSRAFGAEAWNQLLDGCMGIARADAAFLMEPQGLVVAARGRLTADVAEGIGARLMLALDQAAQMSPGKSHTVCVEFDGRWLTGVRLSVGDTQLTLGVTAELPLPKDIREALEELIAATNAVGD
ncbi:MAG: hypothetical protein AB7K71_16130 [Polyangiaceae bacterium]